MNKYIILLISVFFVNSVWATDGSSGCGMGWYILKDNSLVSSTLRMTTNGLFLSQTLGMTFGTSNCQKHDIIKKEQEAIYYAEANQEYLKIEIAEGHGEYISGLAQVLGCSGTATESFNIKAQKNYEKIFPSQNVSPREILENASDMISNDPSLAYACRG